MRFRLTIVPHALAALLSGFPALAAPITYTVSSVDGDPAFSRGTLFQNLIAFGPGLSPGGRAGPVGPVWLNVAGSDGSQRTALLYSTDLLHTFAAPGTYTLGRLDDTLPDATKRAQINALLANGPLAVVDAISGAALQAAIWEVAYEAGTGGYNVMTGAFQVSGYGGPIDPRIVARANQYLADVETGNWPSLPSATVWQFIGVSGTEERYAFMAAAIESETFAVPEPIALAAVAAGILGLAGLRNRRRRSVGAEPGPHGDQQRGHDEHGQV